MSQYQRLIQFKKSSPCPGCGGFKRWKSNQQFDFVVFRKGSHPKKIPQGWQWRGQSKDGWAQLGRINKNTGGVVLPFKPRKAEPEYRQLSPVQRGIEYRKLSDQLTIDPDALAWLDKKGLPREAAQRLGF